MKKASVSLTVLTVALATLLTSCGPPQIGFANVKIENKTEQDIKYIAVNDNTLADTAVSAGGALATVLEFIVEGEHTFTATFMDNTTETKTEKIVYIHEKSPLTVTFGELEPDYSRVTFTNATGRTLIQIELYENEPNSGNPNNATADYSLSITDELPLMGLEDGNSVSDELPWADGSYAVYAWYGNNETDYYKQASAVSLSPDEPAEYTLLSN